MPDEVAPPDSSTIVEIGVGGSPTTGYDSVGLLRPPEMTLAADTTGVLIVLGTFIVIGIILAYLKWRQKHD